MFLGTQVLLATLKSRLGRMVDVRQLEKLRPLGKLEQVSASCHHLGFFNNVGLSAHYKLSQSSPPAALDLRRLVFAAVRDVIRKHRVLSAIPVDEDKPDAYFASLPSVDLTRSIIFVERTTPSSEAEDRQLDAILEDQHNTNFKSGYGSLPFWRLVVLQEPEANGFTASFIYHHAIGDGVSGLVFHSAFRNALEAASSQSWSESKAEEAFVPDDTPLLPPLAQLHPLPLNPVSPSPPSADLKEWTGNSIRSPCKARWTSLSFSPSVSNSFFQDCKEHNTSVTSATSSIIATALFGVLPPTEEALTCIVPVNLRPWLKLPREGAIGTYFDATRVPFTRQKQECSQSMDIWPGAQQASKAINGYLAHISPSGEPYTAVAFFEAIPDVSAVFKSMVGKPRDAAFEVTNVGQFSSSATEEIPLWQVGRVLLSRSPVVSGAAVTVSVATGGDGSMSVGFSWQVGVVEDGMIDEVIEGVRKYFDKYR
ncbi:hypothetical protein ACJ41O_014944 [Fusarium nematophilum]